MNKLSRNLAYASTLPLHYHNHIKSKFLNQKHINCARTIYFLSNKIITSKTAI